jgi:hypothetical protein
MTFPRQCLLALLLSFAVELALAVYVIALTERAWLIVGACTALLPFLRVMFWHWFDAATLKRRLILTGAATLGALLSLAVIIPLAR